MERVPVVRARVGRWIGIGSASFAAAVTAVLGYGAWHRAQLRHAARARLLDVARTYQRCLLGADGVPDDQVVHTLYLRRFDGVRADAECDYGASVTVSEIDADVAIDQLPDVDRDLARPFATSKFVRDPTADEMATIYDLRRAIAVVEDAPAPAAPVPLSRFHAISSPEDGFRSGELLVSELGDGDEVTIKRLRGDLGVVDERVVDRPYLIADDDLVFATPQGHLVRWRGATRIEGPSLRGLGRLDSWRGIGEGGVGVFVAEDGYRAQRFDGAQRPVGPAQVVASAEPERLAAIAPDGTIGLLEPETTDCTAAHAIWSWHSDGVLSVGAIGQPRVHAGDLPERAIPIISDCDDAHYYVVLRAGYYVCDRVHCALARTLPDVGIASVHARDGGAEALVQFDGNLGDKLVVVLRDTHGDGRVTIDLYEGSLPSGPFSFDGRWFVPRTP